MCRESGLLLECGQPGQGITRQAAESPVLEQVRAEPAIEADGGLVPIEHRPFHAAPAALERETSQMLEQLTANPAIAILVAYEQVFEIQPRTAQKGRVV